MTSIIFLNTAYDWYMVQLWNSIKGYSGNIKLGLMTTQTAKEEYEKRLILDETDEIFACSFSPVALSVIPTLKQVGHYTILHLLTMEMVAGLHINAIRKKADYIYLSVGGSDLYRESKNPMFFFLQKRILKHTSVVSSENIQTKECFLKTYGKLAERLPHHVVRYGVDVIDELKKLKSAPEEVKEKLRIGKDKIVVMLGHNGSRAHQHIKMLDAVSRLDKEIKEKCFFLIPMTYGCPGAEYRNDVKQAAQNATDQFMILGEFLSKEEMAEIARMTDVMIHVQDTDQLSSTMMAHMYDENIVIAGSWLPYGQIKEEGIRFWEVDEISDLTGLLEEMIINIDKYKDQCRGNREKVYRFSSWEYCIKDWYNVYETMLEKAEER